MIRIVLIALVLSLSLGACKKELTWSSEDSTFTFYRNAEINKINQIIRGQSGEFIIVGRTSTIPILLVLDAQFTPLTYKRFDNYGPGEFKDVIQRRMETLYA